jgi:hypothetical protein
MKRERYSISKYNSFEVRTIIKQDTYYFGIELMDKTPWEERKGVKTLIEKYADNYFYVIENWIYNYLIKNDLQSIDDNNIDYELIDWLLTNDDIKRLGKPMLDYRIIAKIIFTVECNLDKKSTRIGHCWGEISLRENVKE